jgi:hypothetical protein
VLEDVARPYTSRHGVHDDGDPELADIPPPQLRVAPSCSAVISTM